MRTSPEPEPAPAVPVAPPLVAGETLPEFDLAASFGRRVSKQAYAGRRFILYFYPKADTSGCTRQACDFEEGTATLGQASAEAGVPVIGVSRDPLPAIDRFAEKNGLTFPLASDLDGTLIKACGGWVQKSMYGRSYMGIDRSTFLIDQAGTILRVWRKVKVPGHATEVLKAASRAGTD